MSAGFKLSDEDHSSSPSYLLASLFAARKAGDVALERFNARRLEKLGIKVHFASDIKPQRPARRKAVNRD
jgi:hypothetical protein